MQENKNIFVIQSFMLCAGISASPCNFQCGFHSAVYVWPTLFADLIHSQIGHCISKFYPLISDNYANS